METRAAQAWRGGLRLRQRAAPRRPRLSSPRELAAISLFAAGILAAVLLGGRAVRFAGQAMDELGGPKPYVAQDAAAFVAGLGVNTHLGWPDSPYADLPKVLAAAEFIGVRKFRDSLDSPAAVEAAAAAGVRFDIIVYPNQTDALARIDALAKAHPGAIAAVEGPNEVDAWPVAYRGARGYPGAIAFQKALFAGVRATPSLKGVPVYNTTVSGVEAAKYDALGNLSAATDFGNVHIYYGGGQPQYGWSPLDPRFSWTNWLKAGTLSAPGRPLVVSEVGATTWSGGVSEAVQAKQMLNALMDAARTGVAATYIYELADSRDDPAGTNSEAHFGLFRHDWQPKPAAGALRNLTAILTRGGRDAGAKANGALSYVVRGLPAYGGAQLFQQADGTFDLALWAEPDIWDEQTRLPIAAPVSTVTVSLEAARQATLYDPLLGRGPVGSLGLTREVKVELTDHPVILELGR